MDERRSERTEIVHDDETRTVRTEQTVTDPVSGEVIPSGPVTGQTVVTRPGGVYETRDETVVGDPYAARRQQVYRVQQAVYLIFGLIEGLLALRFVLRLLGANPQAGFAAFVYGITAPFLAPFNGLFGQPQFNGSVVEWNALIAIVVYALIAWVIAKIIWLVAGETRQSMVSRSEHIDTRIDR